MVTQTLFNQWDFSGDFCSGFARIRCGDHEQGPGDQKGKPRFVIMIRVCEMRDPVEDCRQDNADERKVDDERVEIHRD